MGPTWTGENCFFRTFLFLQRYLQKTCVRIVNDYADIVSADTQKSKQLTKKVTTNVISKIACPRSQWLSGHIL